MFGRAQTLRRRQNAADRREEARVREVQQLRAHIARLENALARFISASDDVLIDLHNDEGAFNTSASARDSGFASEWSAFEPAASNQADDGFFSIAETDQRARRWLLADG